MTDQWETNLTEQPVSQKNDETAHVLWFGIELLKILEFFWVLLEATVVFFFPPQYYNVKVVNSWADTLAV